jgi:uncharacterized protein Veg
MCVSNGFELAAKKTSKGHQSIDAFRHLNEKIKASCGDSKTLSIAFGRTRTRNDAGGL